MGKDKRIRNTRIHFWVTDREHELIHKKMTDLGTTNLSAYLRKIAIDGLIVKLDLPELQEMVSLLRRSSNNLNQIAKWVHESGRLYDTDIEDVLQTQEKLWDMANGIIKKLSMI